jgi:hypothetical protein
MNHDGNPDGSTLTRELRDALSELATPERPPLTAITSRGRAHRQRRLGGIAGLGVAGAAACTALALGLTGALGAAPARSAGAIQAGASARGASASTATIRTAAFTLTRNANGTDTLTLTMSQMLDPAVLQQALAQDGIRALVKTGIYCSSSPAAPDPASIGVLSVRLPVSPPHVMVPAPSGPAPSELKQIAARTVTVINPAAMPSGTELFFGYSTRIHALFTDLIYTSSYTCSNNPYPGATP